MKTNELIARLQAMVAADPAVGELPVLTEGCDCYGPCDGARVLENGDGWTEKVVLLQRNDK